MKQTGGFFTYEPLPETENHYPEDLCPPGGSLRFFMSGRCANYCALQDICLTDTKKTAYVPVYTCETVLVPFLKAGYKLLFCDVSRDLTPIFDERILDHISIVNLCGYYGFCSYNREFIQRYSERGIIIVEDTTHSLFSSDGVDSHCDCMVGGMRKWIGVSTGGPAIKGESGSSLPVLPSDEARLSMRSISMRGKQQLLQSGTPDPQAIRKFNDTFWDAEMMLRHVFNSYGSDRDSEYVVRHYDLEQLKQKHRASYQYLLSRMPKHPQLTMIFPVLKKGTVPSHLIMYAEDRDMVQSCLTGRGIETTTYWPQDPVVDAGDHSGATYIYSHVLSFTCDWRYEAEDMEYICGQIEDTPERQELKNKSLKIVLESGNTGTRYNCIHIPHFHFSMPALILLFLHLRLHMMKQFLILHLHSNPVNSLTVDCVVGINCTPGLFKVPPLQDF